MKKAVEVENLSFSYKDNDILKNICLSVYEREFFIIIGPNGSGKTTLMKVITGILKARKGRLRIFNRSLKKYSGKALAKTIAFVPQMGVVDFPFTVSELVLMGRFPHLSMFGFEQKKDMEIASRAMTLTGVEHLAHRTMEQLSGGELQRVFIARALCQEPGIILLDEPTACLDIAHQVMLMDLMEKLREEIGFTVIMVSHDVNLAAMYATRLLLLNSGIITEVGKPRDILKREALENTYKCKLLVDKNPFGDLPRITPLPEKFKGVYV